VKIEIDPAEVVIHRDGKQLTRISFRGWAFEVDGGDYLRHQAKLLPDYAPWVDNPGSHDMMLREAGARLIEDRVAAMSSHQRLAFYAATRAVS